MIGEDFLHHGIDGLLGEQLRPLLPKVERDRVQEHDVAENFGPSIVVHRGLFLLFLLHLDQLGTGGLVQGSQAVVNDPGEHADESPLGFGLIGVPKAADLNRHLIVEHREVAVACNITV